MVFLVGLLMVMGILTGTTLLPMAILWLVVKWLAREVRKPWSARLT